MTTRTSALQATHAKLRDQVAGKAARFPDSLTGIFNYLEIPHAIDFEGIKSVDFWFYPQAVERGTLLAKDTSGTHLGNFEVYLQTAPFSLNLRLQNANSSYELRATNIQATTWHHLAISFDEEDGVTLFLNGVLAPGLGSMAKNATLEKNHLKWILGASNSNQTVTEANDREHITDPFNGIIDELRFRSEPFTKDQATDVYRKIFPL